MSKNVFQIASKHYKTYALQYRHLYTKTRSHLWNNEIKKVATFKKSGAIAFFGLTTSGTALYVSSKPIDLLNLIQSLSKYFPFLKTFIVNCKEDNTRTNRIKHYAKDAEVNETKSDEDQFNWKEFFRMIYKEKYYFLAAVLSAFAVAILNILIPQELGNLINGVYKLVQENAKDYYNCIYKPSLDLLKIYTAQSLFTFSYIYLLGIMGENMATDLKVKLFSSIVKQDIAFYDKSRSGELINRLTNDVQEFKSSFKLCISQGLRSITQIIGSSISLFFISPKLTFITTLIVPLLVGAGSLFGVILRVYSKDAQWQVAKSTAVADEAINNVRTVRAFSMEDTEIEMFKSEVDKACSLNVKLSFGIGIFQGLSNFFINSMVLGVIYAGGYMMINNEINAGQLMSYLAATQMIQKSFAQFSILFGQALKGISSGGRVFEYIRLVSKIPTDDIGIKIVDLKGDISFKNIDFSYPTRQQASVLRDFNLNIKSGEIVAIVGNSGSGKSTACALLERFYDPDNGLITIDGVNIKDLSPKWLRSKAIGYISQEPILFHTSIAENIRYGKPDATDEEVEEAAKLANAHDFIMQFPNKYDTMIGERGVTISGGQKQRIAISRALLKNPKILILDEATSALDAKSEQMVQETINNVIKNRTVLVIAHRLSTIKNADLIVVVDSGRIIETGKHDDLMKLKGSYYNLFKIQMSSSGRD